jgi:hypothetical protein
MILFSLVQIFATSKLWSESISAPGCLHILHTIAYRILVGKPDGKRPLERLRRRLVDNIKMDLRDIGWDGMDWIDVFQDRDQWNALVNTVMNLWVT